MRARGEHGPGASSPVSKKERTAFGDMRAACVALESSLTDSRADEVRKEALRHEGAAAWIIWEKEKGAQSGSCLSGAIDAFVSKNGQGALGWRTEGSDVLDTFLTKHFGTGLWQHAVFSKDGEHIELRHTVH